MTMPFDAIAARYSALWSDTGLGIEQRAQVWREVDSLFPAGQHILDAGCGIGDDALHFAQRGIRVTAFDASPVMVRLAQARGVAAQHLAIEELTTLNGPFDGALSNFGALNCVPNLEQFSHSLALLIRPGGFVAICVLSRFSWRETLRYAARLDFRKAIRRWSGHATWRGIDIYYRNAAQMERALAPHFHLLKSVPIGAGDHQLYILRRSAA